MSTLITILAVPPFIPDKMLEQELCHFRAMVSWFRTVGLGCKSNKLKHVLTAVFYIPQLPLIDFRHVFRVKHGEGHYIVVSMGSLRCFECSCVSHKHVISPHKPALIPLFAWTAWII